MKTLSIFFLFIMFFFSCTSKNPGTKSDTTDTLAFIKNSESSVSSKNQPTGPNPRVETYEKLSVLLKEENFSAAEKLISENHFDINVFEQKKHNDESRGDLWFDGLLWNYSKKNPNPLVVQFLLNHGVDPNLIGETWMDELTHRYVPEYTVTCDRKIAEMLINAGSKYALDGLMECAVNDKSIPEINDLLMRGAKPDIAFKAACEKHDLQLFSKLIQAGGNVDVALFWAVQYEDLNMAKEMVSKSARIKKTENIISNVAYSKNEELKSLVLNAIDGKMYSDVDSQEGCEPSLLMNAAKGGDLGAVEFMLKSGADPNVYCQASENIESALEDAETNGHTDVAELLKKYGAKKPEK
jgi:ankyrin repeat protein